MDIFSIFCDELCFVNRQDIALLQCLWSLSTHKSTMFVTVLLSIVINHLRLPKFRKRLCFVMSKKGLLVTGRYVPLSCIHVRTKLANYRRGLKQVKRARKVFFNSLPLLSLMAMAYSQFATGKKNLMESLISRPLSGWCTSIFNTTLLKRTCRPKWF